MSKIIYLSGPMTGLPEFNYPAFHAEAARLRTKGFTVVNPAELCNGACVEWADYMRRDIAALIKCNSIHLMRGWQQSKGAWLEINIAHALNFTFSEQT